VRALRTGAQKDKENKAARMAAPDTDDGVATLRLGADAGACVDLSGPAAAVHTVRILLPADPTLTTGMCAAEDAARALGRLPSTLRRVAIVGRATPDASAVPMARLLCGTVVDALLGKHVLPPAPRRRRRGAERAALELRGLLFTAEYLPCLVQGLLRLVRGGLEELRLRRMVLPDARAYRSAAKRFLFDGRLRRLAVDAPWCAALAHYRAAERVGDLELTLDADAPAADAAAAGVWAGARRLRLNLWAGSAAAAGVRLAARVEALAVDLRPPGDGAAPVPGGATLFARALSRADAAHVVIRPGPPDAVARALADCLPGPAALAARGLTVELRGFDAPADAVPVLARWVGAVAPRPRRSPMPMAHAWDSVPLPHWLPFFRDVPPSPGGAQIVVRVAGGVAGAGPATFAAAEPVAGAASTDARRLHRAFLVRLHREGALRFVVGDGDDGGVVGGDPAW
jgi:hypothetical protein